MIMSTRQGSEATALLSVVAPGPVLAAAALPALYRVRSWTLKGVGKKRLTSNNLMRSRIEASVDIGAFLASEQEREVITHTTIL
jgi:hypothetical protein